MKSFARIHETNLKKQGMLPLTFANPSDYDKASACHVGCLPTVLPAGTHHRVSCSTRTRLPLCTQI